MDLAKSNSAAVRKQKDRLRSKRTEIKSKAKNYTTRIDRLNREIALAQDAHILKEIESLRLRLEKAEEDNHSLKGEVAKLKSPVT
ncbi:MAG: hypothetical protein V2I33_19670 [Kangiellaceae bacterium]|nr:hypothetical protein [Kangiellaceae bacterium]